MQITRHADAKPYEAPGHFNMTSLRLQGFDASDTKNFWVGLSTFEPGGGAEHGSTPFEKVYVVIEGQITVTTAAGDTVLGPFDSCLIEPGEKRSIVNNTDKPVVMLVAIPYPPGVAH
ncbi:MAG: cupin domain-containing protein [bacterium]|nr:cupin domain-containing protein [bacterium]